MKALIQWCYFNFPSMVFTITVTYLFYVQVSYTFLVKFLKIYWTSVFNLWLSCFQSVNIELICITPQHQWICLRGWGCAAILYIWRKECKKNSWTALFLPKADEHSCQTIKNKQTNKYLVWGSVGCFLCKFCIHE